MKKKGYKKKHDSQLSCIHRENYPHENFMRLHRSLFYDPRFRELSPKAKEIYLAIVLDCNKGSRTKCTFPYSAYSKITDKNTFHKAKRQLIDNGFIKEVVSRTKPCIYILCDYWKHDSIPKEETKIISDKEHKRLLEGMKNKQDE